MPDKYIIRAEIDATDDMPGMFARDWFDCGVKGLTRNNRFNEVSCLV